MSFIRKGHVEVKVLAHLHRHSLEGLARVPISRVSAINIRDWVPHARWHGAMESCQRMPPRFRTRFECNVSLVEAVLVRVQLLLARGALVVVVGLW